MWGKKPYSYIKGALPASGGQSMPTFSIYSHGDKYNFWHFLIIASYHENGAVYPNSIESLFLLPCRSCSAKVVFLEHIVFTWHLQFLNVLVMEKCQIVLGLFSWGNQSLGCCCVFACNRSSKRRSRYVVVCPVAFLHAEWLSLLLCK